MIDLATYPLEAGSDAFTYEFVSEGPRGLITKRVQFSLIYADHIYNLAFGNVNQETQLLDDQAVSNNSDLELVLATVAVAAYDFCQRHPAASLYVTGSTPVRTRLYQLTISRFLTLIQAQFNIHGELDDEWEPFRRNKPYTAFLVQANEPFNDYL